MLMPSWPSVYCFVYLSFAAAVVMLVLVTCCYCCGFIGSTSAEALRAYRVYYTHIFKKVGPTKWDSLETGTDCKINSIRGA